VSYQQLIESAFIDELEKISSLAGLGAKSVLGAPLRTWGKRALIGAVPGAVAGMAAAPPGESIGGAVKGGLAGAGAGVLGGGILQHQATSKLPGYVAGTKGKAFVKALKSGGGLDRYRAIREQTLPGIV
jgi:hypothetical protein